MKNHLLVFLLVVLSYNAPSMAQEKDSTEQESKKEVYDFILLSSRYQNAFNFLGRDFGADIDLVSTDLMYYFNSGIYFNISAIKFLQEGLPWQYGGTLGYNKDLGARTDINLSYSQFLIDGQSEVTGIQDLGFAQATFGWEWGFLYSTIQLQTLFNERTDYFINSSHSRYFEFDQKLFKKITISFEPKFTLMSGTSEFYRMGGFDLTVEDTSGFQNFQLLNWEAMLPITFGIGYWDLEFQARYINPLNLPSFDESNNRFIFGFQLSYAIPIKKTKSK